MWTSDFDLIVWELVCELVCWLSRKQEALARAPMPMPSIVSVRDV
jgi:hypothetical protein